MARKCIPRNRDKNLHSFAEEHKHGLVFCKRLEAGVLKNIDLKVIANYVEYFWSLALSDHFKKEEDAFLHLIDIQNNVAQQFINEHKTIRFLQKEIIAPTTDKKIILSFIKNLRNHITFEAGTFFPYVEAILTDEQLSEIGKKLAEDEQVEDLFEPQFWN